MTDAFVRPVDQSDRDAAYVRQSEELIAAVRVERDAAWVKYKECKYPIQQEYFRGLWAAYEKALFFIGGHKDD